MAEVVTVDIDKLGNPKISVAGVAGSSCTDLTRELERALGSTTSDVKTADYGKTEKAHTKRAR